MTFFPFNKFLLKIAGTSGFLLSALLASPSDVRAEACASNPSSLSDSCYITPERYVIKVYEMGLCTSDPLSGTDFSGSTCTATLSSSSGIEVDIAGTTASLSGGTSSRPPNGTYTYAYIKMANTFGLRGSYQLNNTTYYSTSSGGVAQSGSAANWTESLYDFNGGDSCSGSPEYSASETLSGGVMKARLSNTSFVTSSACSGANKASRLVGTFAPNTPITIADTTNGLQVEMTVTNSGMTVIPNNAGDEVSALSSGPFAPVFETY